MPLFFLRKPKPAGGVAEALVAGEGRIVVRLSGSWTVAGVAPDARQIMTALRGIPPGVAASVIFDAAGVTAHDSSLPAFVLACRKYAEESGATVNFAALPEGVRRLIALALARPQTPDAEHADEGPGSLLHRAGEWGIRAAKSWNKALDFLGRTVLAILALVTGRARFRKDDFFYFLQSSGVDALPIISLIAFLTGLIMAYVGSVQLKFFGATLYVANLVGLALVREMGALMTAIVLCGRTGSAFAAQLGSMNASDEIAAFRVLGIDPVHRLVLPRMLALTLMMPLLTLFANFVGMLGGLAVVSTMDVSVQQYFNQITQAVSLASFFTGVIKSVFFGALIAWAGCFRGMTSGRSSLDVGNASTGAAVLGITLVIIADAIFAVIFDILKFQ